MTRGIKMGRFGLLFILLIAGSGCVASDPPIFRLVVDESLVNGYQAAYCWRSQCVDGVPPQFAAADYTVLPAGEPIRLNLETPLPDTLNLALRDEVFGADLAAIQLQPDSEEVSWDPGLAAGSYILAASAKWSNGDALYFYAVELAGSAP